MIKARRVYARYISGDIVKRYRRLRRRAGEGRGGVDGAPAGGDGDGRFRRKRWQRQETDPEKSWASYIYNIYIYYTWYVCNGGNLARVG